MIMYTTSLLLAPLSTVEIRSTCSSQLARSLYFAILSLCPSSKSASMGSSVSVVGGLLPFRGGDPPVIRRFLLCGVREDEVRFEFCVVVDFFLDFVAELGAGRPPFLFQYSAMISVDPLWETEFQRLVMGQVRENGRTNLVPVSNCCAPDHSQPMRSSLTGGNTRSVELLPP